MLNKICYIKSFFTFKKLFMNSFKIFATIIFYSLICFACSSNKSSPAKDGNTAVTKVSGDQGSYSFKVAGKEVNENGTLMTGYKADLNTDNGVKILSLILTNASETDGSVSSFMFAIPYKTGATTFTKENDRINDNNYLCTYTGAPGHGDDQNVDPHVKSIIINIDQLTDARVSGTFSGTVIGEDGNSLLAVTNGKFDLPIYKHQ
jgi:hypothetical protein